MESKIESFYIHIPFCKQICYYCDFCKLLYNNKYVDKYLDALKVEIDGYHIEKCKTIYIGGGTPTSLKEEELDKLLSFIDPFLDENIEYTIEVNPETVTEEKMQILKKHRINRLSIGIQTFDENRLKTLNRHHKKSDIDLLFQYCVKYGFSNYSFDFIYGLNNTTIDDIKSDLDLAFLYNPTHISLYSLMIEPNTVFYINNVPSLDDDKLRDMYDCIKSYLCEKDFIHYEVSNFAKDKNYVSRHNLTYWNAKEYYGVGLGASGYVNGTRYQNTKSLNEYLKHNFVQNYDKLSMYDLEFEYIMLKLRTMDGIDFNEFKSKFKKDLYELNKDVITSLLNNNLVIVNNDRLVVSEEGIYILDQIITKLVNKL